MPDERLARKPGFSEGPWVVLGDGQAWSFPRPWLKLIPAHGHEPDHETLVDHLIDCDPADASRRLSLQYQMAASLLTRNYNLGDRDLLHLLAVDLNDPDCEARWLRINQVLLGQSPRTFSQWLRHTLISHGITQDLPWEDAIGVAQMLVSSGCAVPPQRWLDSLTERVSEAQRESLF